MKYATILPSGKRIPINTIFCVGQNYAEHAKEMGSSVADTPVIFLKPSNAVIENGTPIILPKQSTNVHHEVELTVLIGKAGRNIPHSEALSHVAGYGVGLDMTMRDVQTAAKKKRSTMEHCKRILYLCSPFFVCRSRRRSRSARTRSLLEGEWTIATAYQHIKNEFQSGRPDRVSIVGLLT